MVQASENHSIAATIILAPESRLLCRRLRAPLFYNNVRSNR
jgi:hypothetical protein